MTALELPDGLTKQHVIDPEICIRCNTCEATCPVGAVTHNDANYVVDPEKCNHCLDCISPCPTGSIDNWRVVRARELYSLEAQMGWTELPLQEELGDVALADASEAEIAALLADAHGGAGGRAVPPASASKPAINLFTRGKPAVATIQGNFRITDPATESDVRHIVLSFGDVQFPVLEGQSVGIAPPVTDADGKELPIRLYSVASARDGEKRNANNVALTVKRVPGGLVSEWLCDRKVGEKI
jgi:benzoyl-CoA 2,3-dioxygenase component A